MFCWALAEWLSRAVVCIYIMLWDYFGAAANAEDERVQVREDHAHRSASASSVWAPNPAVKLSGPCTEGQRPATSVVAIIAELVQAPATPHQGSSRAASRTDSTNSLDVIEVLPPPAGDTLSPAVAAIAALVRAAATPAQRRSTAVSSTDSTSSVEVIEVLPLLPGLTLPVPAATTLAAPTVVVGPTTPAITAAVKHIKPLQTLAATSALPATPSAATAVQLSTAANPVSSTSSSSSTEDILSYGVATAQNTRAYQEDRAVAAMLHSSKPPQTQGERFAVAAIFDGHGGAAAAEHLQQHMVSTLQERLQQHSQTPDAALAAAVADLESQMLAAQCSSGSTLTAVLVKQDTLYIANVGDSRAVLCRSGQALRLTTDHTPSSEQEKARILAADPTADITADGYCYGLGVSRDLGNYQLKAHGNSKGLSALPEMSTEQLQQEDDFIVIGSDGIFDTLRDSDAITTVRRALAAKPGDCTAAAQAAVDRAIALGSGDNATAVVLLLHSRPIKLPKSNSRLFRNRSVSNSSSSSDGGSSDSSSSSSCGSICNGAAADSSTSCQ